MYWLMLYALIATAIFAVAGLFILICFICCEVAAWFHLDAAPIGIPLALPNVLENGGSENE